MPERHISTLFDLDLDAISGSVLRMGGLAEQQLLASVQALGQLKGELANEVLENEVVVNQMEVDIDQRLTSIIARHQPTAKDLRLLISVSKVVANLERIGDEAARIARTTHRMMSLGLNMHLRRVLDELTMEAQMASDSLRTALDAYARRDAKLALSVIEADPAIDREFESILRMLASYMVEDPRIISNAIDLVFVAKAIERVGDHAKNLAKQVIYVINGQDVRHTSIPGIQAMV
ncbi:MAG: phosphate signaling complex protein PhoU [Aquabacterium sp.]